jgi:DNA replication and repair protein RecF
LNIYYDSSEISAERLDKYEREEVAAGATLVGPHRDDFRVFDEKRDIHVFGSRGEQRLAVLWLKLGELEYLSGGDYARAVGMSERPVLLLDDIFSELDHEHRHMVLDVMPRQQTIITVTDLHLVERGYLEKVEKIEL